MQVYIQGERLGRTGLTLQLFHMSGDRQDNVLSVWLTYMCLKSPGYICQTTQLSKKTYEAQL